MICVGGPKQAYVTAPARRYRDFQVTEVDPQGNLAILSSLLPPPQARARHAV